MNFLDLINLISFIMQLQNNAILQKQATNDDVIADVDRLERKLDTLIECVSKKP